MLFIYCYQRFNYTIGAQELKFLTTHFGEFYFPPEDGQHYTYMGKFELNPAL